MLRAFMRVGSPLRAVFLYVDSNYVGMQTARKVFKVLYCLSMLDKAHSERYTTCIHCLRWYLNRDT